MKKIEDFDIKLKKWKEKYKCSLGRDSGFCDGIKSSRCFNYMRIKTGKGACKLHI